MLSLRLKLGPFKAQSSIFQQAKRASGSLNPINIIDYNIQF